MRVLPFFQLVSPLDEKQYHDEYTTQWSRDMKVIVFVRHGRVSILVKMVFGSSDRTCSARTGSCIFKFFTAISFCVIFKDHEKLERELYRKKRQSRAPSQSSQRRWTKHYREKFSEYSWKYIVSIRLPRQEAMNMVIKAEGGRATESCNKNLLLQLEAEEEKIWQEDEKQRKETKLAAQGKIKVG